MKLLALSASLLCSCATAVVERPNPSGGAPLATVWVSSDVVDIEVTTAAGTRIAARGLNNSAGPREAIKTWGMFDLGRKASALLGRIFAPRD